MGVIKRQGIKNTIITYVGILIGAINIIFIQPRLLTEEELGLTRLLYDFAYLVGLAVPLGLPNIIIKYFPYFKSTDQRHHGFAGFVLLVFFVGFVISSSVLMVFKPDITAHYSQFSGLFVTYFNFIIPFTFIVAAITVTTAYCQSLFKSTIPSFLNDIVLRIGTIVITILYFNKWIDLDTYVYFFIAAYGIQLSGLLIYLAIVDKISFRPKHHLFAIHTPKQMLRFGVLLCLASFASITLRKIDGIILGTASLKLVGVYTTAIFIASFIEVPLSALERISQTRIADSFANNRMTEIEKIYKDSVRYLLLLGGLLFIGINTCTGYVYELGHLPASYMQCLDVVYMVSIGALVNVATGVNSAIMFYSKHYFLATVLLLLTLAVTVTLNIVLIPLYGIYGAAFASLAGAVLYNLVKFLFIYVKFRFQPYTLQSLYIVVVIVAVTLFVNYLPGLEQAPLLNALYKGSVGCLSYAGLIYVLKLAPEEFETGLHLIKKGLGRT